METISSMCAVPLAVAEGAADATGLDLIVTQPLLDMPAGTCRYGFALNGRGGTVDDLIVYRLADKKWMVVVNAANIDKDWDWSVKNAKEMGLVIGKELYNASDEIAQLAVQGPLALKAMQKLTETTITDME